MGDSLRSTLLKKRMPPMPTKAEGDGSAAASDAVSDADPKDANSQRYGKLKVTAAAPPKHGRKYFDSADQKTVGLPAASANAQNTGPSSHATVSHVSSGPRPKGSSSLATNNDTAMSDESTPLTTGNPSLTNLTITSGGGAAAGGGSHPNSTASPPASGSPNSSARTLHNKILGRVKGGGSGDDTDGSAVGSSAKSPESQHKTGDATGPGISAPPPATANDGSKDDNTTGVGTIKPENPPPQGTATGQVHIGATHKGTADILLVEDVRVSQRIAQVALQKARFKVDVASTAEQAVDMFKTSGPYKIVLMDIQLPKMNGIEATHIIRDFEKAGGAPSTAAASAAAAAPTQPALDTPTGRSLIFGLTGAVEEENLRQYRAVGMNGCIAKGKLLATAVKSALEKITEKPTEFVNLVNI